MQWETQTKLGHDDDEDVVGVYLLCDDDPRFTNRVMYEMWNVKGD